MSNYDIMIIQYREGKHNKNVNALKKSHLPEIVDEIDNSPEIEFVSANSDWSNTSDIIAKWALGSPITKAVAEGGG